MSASVNAAFSTSLDQVTLDAGYGTVKSADTSNGSTSDNISQMAKDDTDSEIHGLTTHQAEPSLVLFFQVLFPFLIAGFGMVLAGIVLDIVQHWPLFKEVPETFILVPALLGLKGNLEMTLASRLSTQANTGQMDTPQQIRAIVIANMALIQTQAIVVTFLASGAAITLSWIPRGELDLGHAALLCASSLATASLASFLLSGIMILVVLFSRKMEINPDNVSTPIAASLGDLTTLAILSFFGSVFLRAHVNETWLNSIVIVIFLISLPFWLILARREPSTTALLKDGWSPIVFSMMISSSGGFVLERAMRSFPQMALFQPVINGVGGNLAAVHASRLATFFHKSSVLGVLPQSWPIDRFYSFSRAFFTSDWDARSARVLIFLVVPGHIIFNWLIGLLHTGENPPSSALFTSIYLLAALTQVKQLILQFTYFII